ncbi:MAG TPA: NAD(P)/FAD-dependent oxidoreductase [Gemmatimonadales bacterium]|nr:NAD(P)/FAD-dependent oxidoreductase [Gemmatimonadales bacterium]
MTDDTPYEAVIVGGGPAGLSAALVLGRCRRRVLVCDAGRPRNAASQGLHGYLTRDGIHPAGFLDAARAELARYDNITLERGEVTDAERSGEGFRVTLADGRRFRARKLLLATGLVDPLPPIPGLRELWGRSVHHCPYCDGWEWRDQALAVYGRGHAAAVAALGLTVWSADVVLLSDGPAELSPRDRNRLRLHGILLREERVARLEGRDGRLERIVFENGGTLARHALFLSVGHRQHSDLPARLGCAVGEDGVVRTGRHETTDVEGLYVAGDASKDAQLVIVAAAEGARAAVAINSALLKEDLARREAAARARRPTPAVEPR